MRGPFRISVWEQKRKGEHKEGHEYRTGLVVENVGVLDWSFRLSVSSNVPFVLLLEIPRGGYLVG